MVVVHKESISSNFKGTVIDLETIGEFLKYYNDSREYKDHKPVIFGFITKDGLNILCAKGKDSIIKLKGMIIKTLSTLPRPFYAFNTAFERGVLFHFLGQDIIFDSELNKKKYERKADVVRELGINQYGDPFLDNGFKCLQAWEVGDIENAIKHNRSCLLKERDILLKRGFRQPDHLELVND